MSNEKDIKQLLDHSVKPVFHTLNLATEDTEITERILLTLCDLCVLCG